jgi:hypothetical protein
MISDHGPGLPDDAPIDQARLPTRIRRALALAGLNTVGDICSAFESPKHWAELGHSSAKRTR